MTFCAAFLAFAVLAGCNGGNRTQLPQEEKRLQVQLSVTETTPAVQTDEYLVGTVEVRATVYPENATSKLTWELGTNANLRMTEADDGRSVKIECLERFYGTTSLTVSVAETTIGGVEYAGTSAQVLISAPERVTISAGFVGSFGDRHPLYPESEAAIAVNDLTQMPLLSHDASGDVTTSGSCTSAYSAEWTDAGYAVTLNLRSGVTSNTGAALTATDVENTLYTICSPNYDGYYALYGAIVGGEEFKNGEARNLEGVAVNGDGTITITLRNADYLHSLDVPIIPQDQSYGQLTANDITGFGAYRYEYFNESMTRLVRVTGKESACRYEEVNVYHLDDANAVFASHQTGESKITFLDGNLDVIQAETDYKAESTEVCGGYLAAEISMDAGEAERAIIAAILKYARQDWADVNGGSVRATGISSALIEKYALEGLTESTVTDSEIAQLLEEAGYPSGENFSEMRMSYPSGYQSFAESIQSVFGTFGITVTFTSEENADIRLKAVRGEHGIDLLKQYGQEQDSDLLTLLDELRAADSATDLSALYVRILNRAAEASYTVPMLDITNYVAANPYLSGITYSAFRSVFRDISNIEEAE